jgi:hypothetical protein
MANSFQVSTSMVVDFRHINCLSEALRRKDGLLRKACCKSIRLNYQVPFIAGQRTRAELRLIHRSQKADPLPKLVLWRCAL